MYLGNDQIDWIQICCVTIEQITVTFGQVKSASHTNARADVPTSSSLARSSPNTFYWWLFTSRLLCFQTSVMKTAVVLVCLLVAVAAKPQGFGFGGFGGATGSAGSNSVQGQTAGIFGNSQIQSSSAGAQVSTRRLAFRKISA